MKSIHIKQALHYGELGLTEPQVQQIGEVIWEVVGPEIAALERDLEETKLELERHHRDFRRISEIANKGLEHGDYSSFAGQVYGDALREIRGIVG